MRPERRLKPGVDGGLRAASWSAHGDQALTVPGTRGHITGFMKNRAGCSQRKADLPFLRMRLRDDRPVEGVPVSDEHNLFDAPCQCRVDQRTV